MSENLQNTLIINNIQEVIREKEVDGIRLINMNEYIKNVCLYELKAYAGLKVEGDDSAEEMDNLAEIIDSKYETYKNRRIAIETEIETIKEDLKKLDKYMREAQRKLSDERTMYIIREVNGIRNRQVLEGTKDEIQSEYEEFRNDSSMGFENLVFDTIDDIECCINDLNKTATDADFFLTSIDLAQLISKLNKHKEDLEECDKNPFNQAKRMHDINMLFGNARYYLDENQNFNNVFLQQTESYNSGEDWFGHEKYDCNGDSRGRRNIIRFEMDKNGKITDNIGAKLCWGAYKLPGENIQNNTRSLLR